MSQVELCDFTHARHLIWAPDGDEAFDDGSSVLQLDVGDRVRLIGFRCGVGYHHDPATLRDVWLDAAGYYTTLKEWRDAFIAEWQNAPQISEEEDQKEPNKPDSANPATASQLQTGRHGRGVADP